MLKKIIALIGVGYWGKIHLKYIQKNKNVKISHIFFKKNKNILKNNEYKKNNITNNISTLINDRLIEYVDIVTPISTHANLAIRFAKKGKKVLVEKPLLMNKGEQNEFNKLIKKDKKIITVSYPYTFSKSLNYAQKIIRNKLLGSIKYINIEINQCGRFMQYGVNHLLAPHAISILSIFHDIDKIELQSKNIIQKNNKCETSIILCTKNKKLIGLINLSLNFAQLNQKKNICTIYCDKGTIICDLNNRDKTLIAYEYKRIKKKNFTVARVKKIKSRFYDEKNNMSFVVNNFLKENNSYGNSKLTNKINSFLNYEKLRR